jgi:hypothetical protein
MSIVGAFDVHRRQLTFDYLDTVTARSQPLAARSVRPRPDLPPHRWVSAVEVSEALADHEVGNVPQPQVSMRWTGTG